MNSNNNQNPNMNMNPNQNRNINKKSEMDLEFRDTINDKLNNIHLSLPTQQKAMHTLDMSFITNNPQYQSQINVQKNNLYTIKKYKYL